METCSRYLDTNLHDECRVGGYRNWRLRNGHTDSQCWLEQEIMRTQDPTDEDPNQRDIREWDKEKELHQRKGQGQQHAMGGQEKATTQKGKGQDTKQGQRTLRTLRNRCSMLRCTGQRNLLDSNTNALRECVRTRSMETHRHVDNSVHMTVRLWFSAQLFRHVLDQFQLT